VEASDHLKFFEDWAAELDHQREADLAMLDRGHRFAWWGGLRARLR
jgi:hypothetical protein